MPERHIIAVMFSVLLWPVGSRAQEVDQRAPSKSAVSIAFGAALPMNDLANKSFRARSSGFAQPGPAGAITFTHRLQDDWGLTAALRVQRHAVDEAAWAREVPVGPPELDWTLRSGPWEMATVLFGAFGIVPQGPRSHIELRCMVGALFARSPETDATGVQDGEGIRMLREVGQATGFAISFGAGYRYDLGERWTLVADADLWGGQARFRQVRAIFIEIVNDAEVDRMAYVEDLKQRMNALLITAGVGLRF